MPMISAMPEKLPLLTASGRRGGSAFLVEMAQHVCTLEGRPLPAADDLMSHRLFPDSLDAVVVAVDDNQQRLGASLVAAA